MSNVAREAGPFLVFVDPPEDGRAFGGSRLLFRSAAREFDVDVTDQEDYDWLVGLNYVIRGMRREVYVNTQSRPRRSLSSYNRI